MGMKKRTFLWAAIVMGSSAFLSRQLWSDSQEMVFSKPQTGS